jgi:hypothetical protein
VLALIAERGLLTELATALPLIGATLPASAKKAS